MTTPVPGTGDDMVALADELREFTAMKYMGDCKCGKCQLVPRAFIDKLYAALSAPPASRIEQEATRPPALSGREAMRAEIIEEVAASLARWYPDNVSTNAFCAAVRSLALSIETQGTGIQSDTEQSATAPRSPDHKRC